jgi:uncharacterized protein (DUF2062 family)
MRYKLNEIKQFLNKKTVRPFLNYLNEGVTPRKLALAITLGFILGIFPIIGVTTLLCSAAALIFRLNMAVIQLVNYAVYPVQLFILFPYLKTGAFIFNVQHVLSVKNISELTTFHEVIDNFKHLHLVFLGAILVWIIFAFISGFIIFRLLYSYFKRKAILA